MKKGFYLFIVLLFIYSCSVKKKPIFIKVDNLKIVSVARDTIRLKAEAFFENPNDIGGKIYTDAISVIINGADLAQVSSEEFKVPARDKFTIPLNVVIPARKVYQNNKKGIIGGLLNSIFKRTIKVQFKGELKYKVLGFSRVYPIDKTQEVKIKF